jgi:hypothetical protein
MAIIDFTVQMAPVGMGLVAMLAMTVAGIGACVDGLDREVHRIFARRLGGWWACRG